MHEGLSVQLLVVFEEGVHHIQTEDLAWVVGEAGNDYGLVLYGLLVLDLGGDGALRPLGWNFLLVDVGTLIVVGKALIKEVLNLVVVELLFAPNESQGQLVLLFREQAMGVALVEQAHFWDQ